MDSQDGRTDRDILQGGAVTVSLCGKSYEFKEPGRRQARAMLCEVIEIEPLISAATPADRLRGVDKCLDWLYRWHTEMRRDKAAIDDTADEREISEAFRAVAEMINVPFVRLALRMKEEQSAAAAQAEKVISMPSPVPTS
jgi:hypothetical protein